MNPEVLVFLIPITGILVGGVIAVTSMFAAHQRKMAEIMRRDVQQQQPDLAQEIRAMRTEMAELRDRVNQQALSIDDRARVAERLEGK